MEQRPEQPPEGRLIADAANRLDLSIREAARRAGISYGRWRQIVMGYQNISPGVYGPVHAPAGTVAKMAIVVGITPEQMETEGHRPDAAEAMRRELAIPADHAVPVDFPDDIDAEMAAAMSAFIAELRFRVAAAERRNPGVPLSGRMVFSLASQTQYSESWDALAALGWKTAAIIPGIAVLMAWDAEQAEMDRRNKAASGLAPR